jgi:hypothetical protein
MIQLLFFLRFRSQLLRTNHRVVKSLEDRILEFIRQAGGSEKNDRRLVNALFNESALGVGLDIFVCVEGILNALEGCAGELYGYALMIGKDLDENTGRRLCRYFSSPRNAGVYCDGELRRVLSCYFQFEAPALSASPPAAEGSAGYARVQALNPLGGFRVPLPLEAEWARRGSIVKSLRQGKKNALILGPEFSGKRAGLYEFCAASAFPLVIRFDSGGSEGSGGQGLAAISDAYGPELRNFLAAAAGGNGGEDAAAVLEELDTLQGGLFRDRLHGEVSPLLLRTGRRFFKLLLEAYLRASLAREAPAILILEHINRASESAERIVRETLRAFSQEFALGGSPGGGFTVYGTAVSGGGESSPAGVPVRGAGPGSAGSVPAARGAGPAWDRIFPRIIRLEGEGADYAPDMSRDLWEVAYALALLGRYFPGPLISRLLVEGGKSPGMISRALDMLVRSGLVDTPQDPRPRVRNFFPKAEAVLGGRKELVREVVRNRLLDWVFSNRLRPSFALLNALTSLGEGAAVFKTIRRGDELILKSVVTDLTGGTLTAFQEALNGGRLGSVVGPERAFTVSYLSSTLASLLNGDDGNIKEAFRYTPGEERIYPPFKAQVLINSAAYLLGIRDIDSAQNAIKEALIRSQDAPWSGLAQANRLFSLINLSKQRMGEAVDYAGFAVENAEKSGNYEELAVASYYAAAVQYLYGNLSQAERLALVAENRATQAGRGEWADRARFFQGKLAFDLGRYQDALRLFQDIAENPLGGPLAEKQSLLEAWAYRSRIYSQNPLLPKPSGGDIDADLFEIEGTFLAGDYRRTADLTVALEESLTGDAFVYTEQPDWRSGFAQCELLLLPPREFWDRMVLVYQALALCRLSADGGAEALRIMQRVLRDERLSEMDPGDAFYFYAWYQVLQESGAAQIDMNTAVSMAFKRLQRRASRIDDPKVRQAYLTQPRWNGALSLAAKEHKLI